MTEYVMYMIVICFQDDLLENVVLPHLQNIHTDPDCEVRARAARFLVDITLNGQSQYSTELLDLLKKVNR